FADNARYIPSNCVDNHCCRDFTSREDEVAYGNLRSSEVFDHSFVDALVPAADQDHLFRLRESQRFSLIELAARRTEHNDLGFLPLPYRFNRLKNRFRLENHPLAATEWSVIDGAMPIRCEGSQIVDPGF